MKRIFDELDAFTYTIMAGKKKLIEEHFRIVIQPKPKWLPEWLWSRVLKRLLVLEMEEGRR